LGWLLLGEPPTSLQAARLVTVLSGFYLAQRQRRGMIGPIVIRRLGE
jgi:drug/metabolite transporter (DMT)-like permease